MSEEKQSDNVVNIRDGLRRLAKSSNQEPPGEGLEMPMVSMGQPLSHAAHAIGQILADEPLFRFGDDFVTVDGDTGEMKAMSPNRFCSWVESYLFTTMPRRDGEVIATMKKEYAAQVLSSDRFREQIREILAVNPVRLPVWRGGSGKAVSPTGAFWEEGDWRIELLPAGYDADTKTFTIEQVRFPVDVSRHEATEFLAEVLKGFPFAKEDENGNCRALGVQIAGMVGVFCKSLFADGTIRPMMIFNGNQSGSGKSLLMRMMLCPAFGPPPESSKPGNEELRKQLDIAAMNRKPFHVIDDVNSLHSNDLNRFTNSPVHEARILGQSRTVICPNVTQVFVTGNQLSIAEDLVRRSLVIDLFEKGKATERTFEKVLTPDWFWQHETRARFLGVLWAIVRDWDEAGRPFHAEARHNSAPVWAGVIGSIVHHFNSKLKPFAKRTFDLGGGDESGAALEALLVAVADASPAAGDEFTTGELIEKAEELGLVEAIAGHAKDPRKALGHRLKRMRGRVFTDGKGRRFEFGKRDKSFGAVYPVRFLD